MTLLRKFLAWLELRGKTQKDLLCQILATMEGIMPKLSDLKGDTAAIKGQLVKVFDEQQTRYDEIKEKYDALVTQLEEAELDPETAQNVTEIKTLLQQFDDTIPDTTGVETQPPA